MGVGGPVLAQTEEKREWLGAEKPFAVLASGSGRPPRSCQVGPFLFFFSATLRGAAVLVEIPHDACGFAHGEHKGEKKVLGGREEDTQESNEPLWKDSHIL